MVLIASNNPKLVSRWSRALQKKFDLSIVTQKSSLLRSIGNLAPLVLLLDLDLPHLRAVRELSAIQKLSAVTKILALSASPSTSEGISLLKGGAKGYCGQDLSTIVILKAVRAVRRDEIWAGWQIISEVVNEAVTPNKEMASALTSKLPLDGLSPRKRQVASLVMEGATNKEIAGRLSITEATVKAHLADIFRRFNVSRRHDFARIFEVAAISNQNKKPSTDT